MTTPALRFANVGKRFPGVVALTDVSFEVARGSCHAICGENGAGKSTLGKLISGLLRPDDGTITLDDIVIDFASPRDALKAGVAMVHQELAFCDNLTVAENLCLGALPRRHGLVDRRVLQERATALLAAVGGSGITPERPMQGLSIAEQQLVQIAAAVGAGARVIVFDEPSSSLGESESAALFRLIAELKSRGVTLLYVSHRMEEIFRLCDAVTVLRDGQHVSTDPVAALDEATLVQRMIGRALEAADAVPEHRPGPERLRVSDLSSPGRFREINFSLHAGEIVGLGGLVGAGRSEIAAALFGLDAAARGTIAVNGRAVVIRSPRDAMRHGLGLVPEDRKRQGLVLSMRADENASLATLRRHSRWGWVDQAREKAAVGTQFERLRVRAQPADIAVALSGGNQQKLVLAKWLAADCEILILDEPTRGVDVGAKAELHAWVRQLAADGVAVLLISSELPELLTLSDRIIVLREGRIVGEASRAAASSDRVVRMMTGLSAPVAADVPDAAGPTA
ncbi:MAG: sugar ABC transporter ATP-binding protein [Gemmatimonadota bacterium]